MPSETLDDEMHWHGIRVYRNTNGVARIVDSGGGDGEPSSSKMVVLDNGEMIEEVDVVIMAAGAESDGRIL